MHSKSPNIFLDHLAISFHKIGDDIIIVTFRMLSAALKQQEVFLK